MIPSLEGMGDKLGEAMGSTDFQPIDIWPTGFQPNDVVSKLYDND